MKHHHDQDTLLNDKSMCLLEGQSRVVAIHPPQNPMQEPLAKILSYNGDQSIYSGKRRWSTWTRNMITHW